MSDTSMDDSTINEDSFDMSKFDDEFSEVAVSKEVLTSTPDESKDAKDTDEVEVGNSLPGFISR